MRYLQTVLLPAFVLAVAITPDCSHAQNASPALSAANSANSPLPQATPYAITVQDGNSRVWERTVFEQSPSGEVVTNVHTYTELASGLNHLVNGQWVESKEEIDILPNGTAQAVQGQHQAYFPGDIYEGQIELVTPDGQHLKSRPMGLSYFDGTNTMLIAELTNSIGVVVGNNQVIYPNAFTDFKADLRYTYTKSGFEQDIILREQPPMPRSLGLNPETARLQVLTEFFDTTDPAQTASAANKQTGLSDPTLTFGQMKMVRGKAFSVGDSTQKTPTYKSWQHLDGRTFLVEELPVQKIEMQLEQLPMPASANTTVSSANSMRHQISTRRVLTPVRLVQKTDTKTIQLAKADLKQQSGVVLDYTTIDSDTNNFTFRGDTTYLVDAAFYLTGTTTIEGGTVVKFQGDFIGDFGDLSVYGILDCQTAPNNPAIFTSSDDDSVGDPIDGSSGTPTINEAATSAWLYLQSDMSLTNVIFCYAYTALMPAAGTDGDNLWNCQFIHCHSAIMHEDEFYGTLALHNVLFGNCTNAITAPCDGGDLQVTAEQVTSDARCFVADCDVIPLLFVTNSIIKGWVPGSGTLFTNHVVLNPTGMIFQTGIEGSYYLSSSSPFIDAGNTTADRVGLYHYTTQTSETPEGPSTVDLGFHYLALDVDGNPVSTLVSGVADYLVDANGNGLPDLWETNYFGNLNQTGSKLDSTGENTLLYDYQNGIDPNIIVFLIEATNDFVNVTNVSVQLAITGGVPSDYAIFVNSAGTTNWLTFTTTNLTVSLGATDGVYDVVVGLKGLPADATQTWNDYSFTVDRVPPVVTLTNPVIASGTATVIKPYLQLQGFAVEPLMSLSYDISNAMGIATNENVFVTGQAFDTNRFDFTTNWFQAFDVPLTNGANHLTLRMGDRAGNVATTNFNVTLDYTTATNPPVVTLIWPTNGMAVSGTNVTMRGTMSDETGTIVAQVVNGDGTTNVINGIVERNHMFWLENVPLNGTNEISVQGVDAAGNVTATNLTVKPSSLILTIDSTPGGDDLYKPFGSVSGTVGDAGATVTINGTAATVDTEANEDGTYNWSADNATMSGQGTSTFDAVANMGGVSAHASLAVEMGVYWAVVYQVGSKESHYADTYGNSITTTWNNLFSATGQSGDYDGTANSDYVSISATGIYWTKDVYDWSFLDRSVHVTDSLGTDTDGSFSDANHEVTGVPDEDLLVVGDPPLYVYNYCAKGVSWNWKYADGSTLDTSVSAHTTVNLYTGGKATVSRQNLFGVEVTANEYGKPPGVYNSIDAPWLATPPLPLDITSTTVLGKHPGADGMLWIALPDNAPMDMTVTASQKHFDPNAVPQKYTPVVMANTTISLDPDTVVDGAKFCVGQNVTFGVSGLPDCADAVAMWTLPGTFVNEQPYPATCAAFYDKNPSLLINDLATHGTLSTSCWYVKDLQSASANVNLYLYFSNGQTVHLNPSGQFDMYRPKTTFVKTYLGTPQVVLRHGYLILGHHQMSFEHQIQSDFPGVAGYTQLINGSYTQSSTGNLVDIVGTQLDNFEFPYDLQTITTTGTPYFQDAPHVALSPITHPTSEDIGFQTYLRFKPNGSGNIFVPLRLVTWNLNDSATYTSTGWSVTTGNPVDDPVDNDTSVFPFWTTTFSNLGF